MKRNTMRLLSLMLTLVMLLGVIPAVSAAETAPELTATASATEIWAGEEVTLDLDAAVVTDPWFVVPGSVEWSNDAGKGETVTVYPTATTTYVATYVIAKNNDLTTSVTGTASVKVTVKQPSLAVITLTGPSTAAINEAVELTVSGAGTSELKWTVDKTGATVIDGTFTATKTGTYKVYVEALNGGSNSVKSNTITITVVEEKAAYTVTMADKEFALSASNPKMTYTITDNSTGKAYTGSKTLKFESSNTNVVKVNQTTGALTLQKAGTATITLSVTISGETFKDTAIVRIGNSGAIELDQDGESFDDDKVDLEFTVDGPASRDDVEWFFEVTSVNAKDNKSSPWFKWTASKETDKRELEEEEEGDSIEVELYAVKGYGIARIDVKAEWDDGEEEGTFFVSFYDELDYTFNVKDDVDEFDFDESGVFSAVSKGNTKLSTSTTPTLAKATILDMLDDDFAEYVELDEGNKAKKNEDVGEITADKKKVDEYDPDDANEYEIDDLEYLTFEVDDEGTYYINYVQYDEIDGYSDPLITGEGTLEIVVGKGSGSSHKKGDIEYEVDNKGEINLDEDDFLEFWEDEDMDEDDFGYVVFEDYKSSSLTGTLSVEDGDKAMNKSYKLHFEYDDDEDDSNKDFDLDEVLYEAAPNKTNYYDEIDFVCYSEDGRDEVEGTLLFIVGNVDKDEEEEQQQQTTTTGSMNFSDVKSSDWYYSAVQYVYSNQIMAGTSSTKFEPNSKLTRGMVVTMLWRMEGEPSVTTNSFTDVKDSTAWYFKAVSWAAQNGIVNGVTTTTFAPNNNITREQLAAILYRYADYKGKDTAATKALTGYPDASSVSSYATTAMRWAVTKSIISGDSAGKLNPTGTATRAEAATMFQRFMAQ